MTGNRKLVAKTLVLALMCGTGYFAGVGAVYAFDCDGRGCSAWAEGYCDNGHGGLDGEAEWGEPTCTATCNDGNSKNKDGECGPPEV